MISGQVLRQLIGRLTSKLAIFRQGAWVAGGQLLSALAALATIRIMTELLSPREFGRLTLLIGLSALALGLAASPLLQAIMRYYPDAARTGNVGLLRAKSIRLIAPPVAITAGLLAFGWAAVSYFTGAIWLTGVLIAALLIVDCLRSFELSLLSAARRQRSAAPIYVADAWSRPLLAAVSVTTFGASADAALAGYIVGSTIILALVRRYVRLEGLTTQTGPNPSEDVLFSEELVAAIKRYAWPLAPLAVFGWLSGMGDRYVIANMLTLHDAGIYAAAYGLASRPFLMLSGTVELTMRPVLQNAVSAQDIASIQRTKFIWLTIVTAAATGGVLCFVALGQFLGQLLLAHEFRSATVLMPWLAAGCALASISSVYTRFCYAFDDTRSVTALTMVGAILGLAVLLPAITLFALPGAVLAVITRFSLELISAIYLARRAEKIYNLRPQLRHGSADELDY